MALTPEELAAGERLTLFNARAVGPANPYGLGQGGQRNFLEAAEDLALFGSAVLRETSLLYALVEALTGQAQIAALLIEGGPVTTVQVGDGPIQSGAVKIDLSALSAQLNSELAKVQAAQAQLAATQAGIQSNAIAYANAFGG